MGSRATQGGLRVLGSSHSASGVPGLLRENHLTAGPSETPSDRTHTSQTLPREPSSWLCFGLRQPREDMPMYRFTHPPGGGARDMCGSEVCVSCVPLGTCMCGDGVRRGAVSVLM